MSALNWIYERLVWACMDKREVERQMTAYRDAIAHELAGKIRAEFPDPNPLASVFKPYIGDQIAEFVERGGKR